MKASRELIRVSGTLMAMLLAAAMSISPTASYADDDPVPASQGDQSQQAGDGDATQDDGTGAGSEGTGEVVILPTDANTGVEYRAYRILSGKVDEDGGIYDLGWGAPGMSEAVSGAIAKEDPEHGEVTPQGAAEFVIDSFGGDSTGMMVAKSSSFAWRLAEAVYASQAEFTTLEPSQVATLPAGFYLFMTDLDSFDDTDDETGTSPIYATIGAGQRTQVGEKTEAPTITKQVMESATGKWGKREVSGTGRDVEFRLTITLPSNYATFPAYHLGVTDTMENMSVANVDDVLVTIDDGAKVPVTTVEFSDGVLMVVVNDLKKACPEADSDSVITISYVASLDRGARLGALGNFNTAHLSYTRSPNSDDLGNAQASSATVYSWGLHITKMSSSTKDIRLAGAEFTIGVAGEYEGETPTAASVVGYVGEDGSISETPYVFTSDENGEIFVAGLGAGAYLVSETKAPSGYTKVAKDFFVILSPTGDDDEGPYDLEASLTGDDPHVEMDAEASANIGYVKLFVSNDAVVPPVVERLVDLMQTGGEQVKAVAGVIAVAAVALVNFLVFRKRDQDSE